MRRRFVTLLVGVVLVGAACVPLPAPYPYRSSLPSGLRPPVTLIGDSTLAAMVWYADAGRTAQSHLQAAYSTAIIAQSCQRLTGTSCGGRFGGRPPTTLDEMRARPGQLGEAVVVMAGYDDVNVAPGVDAIMAEANRQGIPYVIFLTYRANVSYVLPGGARASDLYNNHNAVLWDRARRYPTMRVADWNAHSAAHPEWFSRDGIHLSPAGTVELARFIRAHLDSLPLGRCMAQLGVGWPRSGSTPWSGPPATGIAATRVRTIFDSRPGDTDPHVRKVGADKMATLDPPAFVSASSPTMRLRITAVDPCRNGQINVVSAGQNPPTGPGAVFSGGRSVTFEAVVPRAPFSVWVSAQTDVVVQVIGWVPPPTAATAITPTVATAPPTVATAASTTAVPATTEPATTEPATTEPATTVPATTAIAP
jgi:hypothetical protein